MTARSDVLFITDKTKLLKSALGHFRPKWPARVMSAFPDSDHSADIWGGPFISEVGPALFNRFGGAHRVAPGSIDTPGAAYSPLTVSVLARCSELSRPLLPGSNALLNIGRRSPRADIASAGWKRL